MPATPRVYNEVGGYGGSCTCPSGIVYWVGDQHNNCNSLRCDGGTPGQCHKSYGKWSYNQVTCTQAPSPTPPTSGCLANKCRPGGGYTGIYSFNTFVGNPNLCTDKYCEHYLPGGGFHDRCSAAAGTDAKEYADAECAATCAGTCPAPSRTSGYCLTQQACETHAHALGFVAGGQGYAFAGPYGTKGCYSYTEGKYTGHVYFGTGGTTTAMQSTPAPPEYRFMCT